jgi:hypothetical protein
MAGRAWKDWEISLTKEVMLKYRSEGKTTEMGAEHLETRLDNRTAGGIKWYWNNRIAKEQGMNELIGKADREAAKRKKTEPERKKQWYQATKSKVVTLPYEIVTEIERIRTENEASLYNLMELSTNPILSEFLSDSKNTQLFFRGLEVGFKADKTKEEILIDKMIEYKKDGRHSRAKGMIEALLILGRHDIIEEIERLEGEA